MCICTTSSELINHFKRNLSGLQWLFCLGKNVFEQKMVCWIGNTSLLQMFYLKIMLRLYLFFSIRIKLYIQTPQPSFRSICYIFNLRSRRKYYSYNLLLTLGIKKSLDLNIAKLQSHKRATFLKICKSNKSFNQ